MNAPTLERGFRDLGRPQTYARETVKDMLTTNGGVMAYIEAGATQLSYFDGKNAAYPLEYATGENGFTLATPRGALHHFEESSFDAPYKCLAIGELATQAPDQFVAGMSFGRPHRSNTIRHSSEMVHLFTTAEGGNDRFEKLACRVLDPDYWTPENAEATLLSTAYTYVPTGSGSTFAGALIARAATKTEANHTNNFGSWMEYYSALVSQDKGIKAAEQYDEAAPELSERIRLTRCLLHQLNPDATLYGNQLAITIAETALNDGIRPIDIREVHASLRLLVSNILTEYKPGAEYL